MKTIILLGGNVEAVPIIERASALGHRAVVVDNDARCPGRALTDDFVHASCYHADRAIASLSRHAYTNRLFYDGVLCAAVDAPHVAAEIAARFGLPGLGIEAAWLSADKLAQKKALAGHVPLPMFKSWPFPVSLHKMTGGGGAGDVFTHIVKPVDSRGGRGVVRVTKDIDPAFAYEIARGQSPTGRVMVEQWLDGTQLSTESIVQDGRALFTAVGLRNYARLEEFAPFVIEDGFDEPWGPFDEPWGPYAGSESQADIGRIIEHACRALNWYQSGVGTVKGDLVIHDERFHVIELAARLSGGFFSTHGIPLAYGVDFAGVAIRAALGEHLNALTQTLPAASFVSQRYVFPEPQDIGKTVVAIDNHRPGHAIFHSWNIHEDTVVQHVTSHPARWGQCIAAGATDDEARRGAEQGVREMKAGVVLK